MITAIADCLRGVISAEVAIARALLAGAGSAAIAAAVDGARGDPPTPEWQRLQSLLAGRHDQLDTLAETLRRAGAIHAPAKDAAGIAAFFDQAAREAPEAGVALYSLGDPAILHAATGEIVRWLDAEQLVPPGGDVLDLGCGIGRVAAALAPSCRSVLGLDVSPGMVAEAQRRHGGLTGLRFAVADGQSLPPGPYDLVLLVDSMPYMVQAGFADAVIDAAAGSLRAGGAIAILNLSYGREAGADRADSQRWAGRHGMTVAISRPFRLWDGEAFTLRRRNTEIGPTF